ncbi:MAG: Stk1 family PASTA domain-containing Ser/Thr kinase [bacterium]|nr:Stk1 family PASTA domain-containing Ser/Thr kinase [bacterium]MCM1376509.1 Stk1 family PASTA domain-containing Ser/Thr kinase [Muribaculum sp.]MCM1410839.1 Stk1 family PASTA domain-containing Ser/Thr kinase [Lachnospiraceae bacterium]
MVKIGMMIGDRYEILEKIGTGGMSDVYKAKCHKLNRYVAVKVLKQEFSENENFVSKFRIEAQAAAGLMHSNIVNVYDVGEDSGIYYIVMELVEGITLKKYIERKARLSYKEAVSIAIQVSMGIEAAHNNHIIHRDIKPQNIIISRDGKVKVTDFGIAKAATSNTITSNVMGSVHYTSPEQARGGYSDEKSDIYSLGITLFEMLTGRVPFNGETTVAIAIKHIQEEMISPKEYVPEIPGSVEAIVLKCCQKSPDRRYQSMAEVIADLKQSLIHPDDDFVVNRDMDEEASTRAISESEMNQIKRKAQHQDVYEEQMRLNSQYTRPPVNDEDYDDEEEYYEEDEYDAGDGRMEKVTTILAVIAGVVICIIILVLVGRVFGFMNSGDIGSRIDSESGESSGVILPDESSQESSAPDSASKVEMVDVTGWDVEDAKRELIRIGLVPEVTTVESDVYEKNRVINTDIQQGTEVEPNTTVKLTVSAGVSAVDVPEVTGDTYEEAYNKITMAGLQVSRLESFSPTVEVGRVISQMPPGGEPAAEGSTVTLTVSQGVDNGKVPMPNFIGKDRIELEEWIYENNMVLRSIGGVYSDTIAEGMICYQNFSEGTLLDQGAAIEVNVSQGKDPASGITYKCNAIIDAPTLSEAPDYSSGGEVHVVLVSDSGKTLMDVTTSTFPLSANFYGITSQWGTITMTYTATVNGVAESKSIERRIEFVQE